MSDPCEYKNLIPKLEVHMELQTKSLGKIDTKLDNLIIFQAKTEERLKNGWQKMTKNETEIAEMDVEVGIIKNQTMSQKMFALLLSVSIMISGTITGVIVKIIGSPNEKTTIEKDIKERKRDVGNSNS